MRRVKLAICTDGIYPHALGGMQKHSKMLIESLMAHEEFEIYVIHPHQQRIFNTGNVKEISITPIDEKRIYLIECYKYSKRVYDELVLIGPDVIYSQGLSVWYNIDRLRNRLIVNPHGLEPFQATGNKNGLISIPFKFIFRYIFNRCAVVISLGGKLTDILRAACPRATLAEIPNGVALPEQWNYSGESSEPLRVLFVARFAHNKGIDVLFNAFALLAQKQFLNKYLFTLAGTGPLYDHYASINKYAEVHLCGYVDADEVASLYSSHHVYILPTLFEGMPTAVLEAMSYGLPVIVSDVGATNVLVNDENGKLIKAGSAAEIVEALEWFRQISPEKRMRLSENGRRKVAENFTWQSVARKHAELFLDISKES